MSKRTPVNNERLSTVGQALQAAAAALRAQRPDEAERLAAGVLKSNRANLEAAKILGQALMQQGRPAEVILAVRSLARRNEDPELETLLAKALASDGKAEAARAQLRLATTRRPAFPLAFLELGEMLGEIGDFDAAAAVFEEGLALVPGAVVLRLGQGYLHLKRNDAVQARASFLAAQAMAPERHDVMVGLARVLVLTGEYGQAADLYRAALVLQPGDVMTRINLGKCQLEMGARGAGEATLRVATARDAGLVGLAMTALAGSSHGRVFLKPSAAVKFLGPGG